jgi:methylmalonyl-CoA/ethylmalonyl-CoA epimerase
MMTHIKKIHHVGISVRNLEKSLWFWNDVLGLPLMNIEEVPSHNVRVAFLSTGESIIELVTPLDGKHPTELVEKAKRVGLDHLCLEVDDIEQALAWLKKKNVKLIDEEPVVLPGRKIAFVHPDATDGVLLEFYELI